ncbi:MAG: hypothetical protein OCD02_01955 [Spirochaetaceae bacterium]
MKKNLSSSFLIQIAIGLYFTLSGLLGLMGYNSGTNQLIKDVNNFLGRSNNYLPLIISICFLVSGLALLAGVLLSFKKPVVFLVIFILWIVYIVMNYFMNNFLEPDLLPWLRDLSLQVIILAGLWGTTLKVK